jgi:hypothetical protein
MMAITKQDAVMIAVMVMSVEAKFLLILTMRFAIIMLKILWRR